MQPESNFWLTKLWSCTPLDRNRIKLTESQKRCLLKILPSVANLASATMPLGL